MSRLSRTRSFYMIDQNDDVYVLDPATGLTSLIGNIASAGLPVSLEVDAQGRLVGTCNNGPLFEIDKTTAVPTITPSPGQNGIQGLGIDADGVWYGVNRFQDQLHTIDPVMGTVTTIGALTPANASVPPVSIVGPTGFEIIDTPIMRGGKGCTDGNGEERAMLVTGTAAIGSGLMLEVERGSLAFPAPPAGIILGFSNSLVNGAPLLPLDLGVIGAPGCRLYTSIEASFGLTAAGTAQPFVIPNQRAAIGLVLFLQGIVVDTAIPPANPFGVATTDVARVVITS